MPFASSAASRHLVVAAHLRRRAACRMNDVGIVDRRVANLVVTASAAPSSARRPFAATTRRAQPKGRRAPPSSGTIPRLHFNNQLTSSSTSTTAAAPPPATTPATSAATAAQQQQQSFRTSDPHSIANEMVSASSSAKRIPGTESVATLTPEQRMSNFAMAGGLLAFVSYVFYYSLASVGGENKAKSLLFGGGTTAGKEDGSDDAADVAIVTPGFEDFLREANEGRTMEEERAGKERKARGDARELVDLEESTSARLKLEGLGEEVIAGSSASAEEEREMARIAGFDDDGGNKGGAVAAGVRPMWKRVVFFWRRE